MTGRRVVWLVVLFVGLGGMMAVITGPFAAQSVRAEAVFAEARPLLWQATATPEAMPPAGVPTLVVPTPVPPLSAAPAETPEESALARVREDGVLRVGVLYNNPPMSRLNERGLVEGYEADLVRAIAEDWDVQPEFIQVTRQNAQAMLLAGEVDLLMASVVHRQEYEDDLAFSQPYFASGQLFLVRHDSDIQNVAGVMGRRVGVVQGTISERALGQAMSSGRLDIMPQLYLTLNSAIGGLGSGEVDAVLAERIQLLPLLNSMSELRLVEQRLVSEPLAVAMRRHDVALRYLVDRSLQRIYESGALDDVRRAWFPSVTFSHTIPVWEGLEDDPRSLADLETGAVAPGDSIVARVRAGQSLRIAGFLGGTPGAGLDSRLDAFYRALAAELGARWGVPVELLEATHDNAADLVAAGQADLAIGVIPRWDGPYEAAYTAPIIQHGDRLLKPASSDIAGFTDLRGGRWVGIFASEPGTADRVNELAESVNTAVNIFTIVNDDDAVYSLTVDKNIDVVFGDSLRLIPQVQANPDLVELTERWYSTEYYTLAVPRYDPDFWSLVELTLQTMINDGTFAQLWSQHVNAGDAIVIDTWPGEGAQFMGVNLLAR
ncbi:MAG: transporter substrate-binding domain-containing protein [Anaerolineae bacterium]|nr:transporter substrate-binding domain-containing protein [Anaerolineae bacterium]